MSAIRANLQPVGRPKTDGETDAPNALPIGEKKMNSASVAKPSATAGRDGGACNICRGHGSCFAATGARSIPPITRPLSELCPV
jgi:hypothetical protein